MRRQVRTWDKTQPTSKLWYEQKGAAATISDGKFRPIRNARLSGALFAVPLAGGDADRTYDMHRRITESLNQALTRTLDLKEVALHVGRAVVAAISCTSCRLFHTADGQTFHSADGSDPDISLDPATRRTLAAGRIVARTDRGGSPAPTFATAALLVPLCVETQLEGVLVLGPKRSDAPYEPPDYELLRTLATHTAMALRNVASYRRVTELLSSLESQVDERTRALQDAQAELQDSNQKLRELDRIKTQFFADASHELRTPLTLVLGPLEEIQRQAGTMSPRLQELVNLAHSNAATLLVLTDTFLDLSRVNAGGMQPIIRAEPLGPLLEASAEPFRWLAAQRGLALELHAPPHTAWCDATMVSKIVGNLLANALKFTSHGYINVSLDLKDASVGIRVADTGPGIPAVELPFIFDRYRQASTAGRSTVTGSGLGLALVRELTELQGGTVEVQSTEGHGTTFIVWLPARPPVGQQKATSGAARERPSAHLASLAASTAAAVSADSPVTAVAPSTETLSILLIDDKPEMLAFLRDLLGQEYHVRYARNATEALDGLEHDRPDLIVSDVMMPGPDGVALCKTLKQNHDLRHIPLILLTARASLESKLSGLEAGADDYITKPFHPAELKARVKGQLRMRQMERELHRSHVELAGAYHDLRDAQTQLIQAEKLASLGTLVAGVAHEINNPISFILSSIDLISTSVAELHDILEPHVHASCLDHPTQQTLRRALQADARIPMLQENIAICRDGATRAAQIVRDLRTFCRPRSGQREPTDLHTSIDQALRLLQGEYKGRVTVHRHYGDLPRVMCDAGQMSQVFLNLLANAMQAIEAAGEIFVHTRYTHGTATIEIRDTGRGMDEAVSSRVFDPFFTTKEVGKGTGLGLSIARSLVRAHGGQIHVQSTVEPGSVFTVTLPVDGGTNEHPA